MNPKVLRGTLCAVIGGIFWGFSGCCGQFLFSEKNIDPYWLTGVRLLSSGAILLLAALFTQRKNLTGILKNKKELLQAVCFGIFGLMLCQLSYLVAIDYTNAATTTVIQYAGPVLVMVAVCFLHRRLPVFAEVASLVLAVFGTFLVATHGNPSSLVISEEGLVWCIIAALTVVTYTLLPGKLPEKRSSTVVNACGMLAGGVVTFFLFRIWEIPVALDLAALGGIAGMVLFGTVGAFTLYLQAISDIGPVRTSILASVEPVASALISWAWLGNTFEMIDILGFACIISTVFLLALRKKEEKSKV